MVSCVSVDETCSGCLSGEARCKEDSDGKVNSIKKSQELKHRKKGSFKVPCELVLFCMLRGKNDSLTARLSFKRNFLIFTDHRI